MGNNGCDFDKDAKKAMQQTMIYLLMAVALIVIFAVNWIGFKTWLHSILGF